VDVPSWQEYVMSRFLTIILSGFISFAVNAGECNKEGFNEKQNFIRCMAFASEGYVSAKFAVAHKYYYGLGTAKNYSLAFKWYMESATKGNFLAQNMLGSMYYHGYGVTQDYEQAAKWFKSSAEQGHPYAPFNLGKMFYMGEGVPQDFMYSHMWNNIAAEKGITKAAKFRNELSKKMTPDEVGKAQELAKLWMSKFS
jgi:TPR repeat protein